MSNESIKKLLEAETKSVIKELEKAHTDAILYGCGFVLIDSYGNAKYMPSEEAKELAEHINNGKIKLNRHPRRIK